MELDVEPALFAIDAPFGDLVPIVDDVHPATSDTIKGKSKTQIDIRRSCRTILILALLPLANVPAIELQTWRSTVQAL